MERFLSSGEGQEIFKQSTCFHESPIKDKNIYKRLGITFSSIVKVIKNSISGKYTLVQSLNF